MSVGTIHKGTKSVFLKKRMGAIEDGENIYDVFVLPVRCTPIVQSRQSGKYFTLSWQDIVGLAIKAGIDK